jgi:hypothetical protein
MVLDPFVAGDGRVGFFEDKTHFGDGREAAPGRSDGAVFCGGHRDAPDNKGVKLSIKKSFSVFRVYRAAGWKKSGVRPGRVASWGFPLDKSGDASHFLYPSFAGNW